MDDRNAELDRRVEERVEHLNATRGWPWQVPGAVSVSLDGSGRVVRYLASEDGDVCLGPVGPQPPSQVG